MLGRPLSLTLALLIGATMSSGLAPSTLAAQTDPAAGPPCDFQTELLAGDAVPLKDAAIISRTACGYRYRAGQQNSHLVVTLVKDGLRFVDTRTSRFDRLTPDCRKLRHLKRGVAAVCRVPDGFSEAWPLLIEVWPRLGNDYVDGSTLPATFAMTVLSDAGNDVAHLGAGPDFFNGASGRDRVWGGAGDDWLRTGDDSDHVWGGAGDDYLVGVDGPDTIVGGMGVDQIYCGNGTDGATVDRDDSIFRLCEQVDHR